MEDVAAGEGGRRFVRQEDAAALVEMIEVCTNLSNGINQPECRCVIVVGNWVSMLDADTCAECTARDGKKVEE